jgi:hypothetical protein
MRLAFFLWMFWKELARREGVVQPVDIRVLQQMASGFLQNAMQNDTHQMRESDFGREA